MEEIDKLDKATTFIYAILIFMNTFYIFGFLLFNGNINLRFNTNMFFIVMPIVIFVVSIPGIISYFSQDNSVMLKMTKDLTMEKLKEQKRYLPEDLISLLAFAILQGFSYIEITLE